MKEIRDGASQSDIWPDFFYYYDKVGNIVTLETKFTEGGVLKTDVQNFTYDHRQRLLSASSSGPLSNYTDTYTYDQLGNIKTFDGKSYTYGNTAHKQAVTSVTGGWTFGYDANGNMTSRTDGTGTYTQVFDVENRLITVIKSGAGTTKFAYDASGQRVRSEKPNGDIIYTPFPNYEVEVRGAVTIKRSTYALAGQTIALRVSGDPTSANNGIFYVHADHLGSTTMLGKGSATSPFAGSTTPTQAVTDRDFTGQKENRELGLLYYNARYYLPGIGRFVSADTIMPDPGAPQSLNRYSYVRGNPLNRIDPSGNIDIGPPADLPPPPNPWTLTDELMDLNDDNTVTGDEAARAEHYYQRNADHYLLQDFNNPAETRFGLFGGPRTIGCGADGEPDCGTTRHPAVDGGGPRRSDIYSIGHGRVAATGDAGFGFGQFVIIEHDVFGITLYSVYAHLQPGSVYVEPGYVVEAGARIGGTGDSGGQTNVHLHFEIRRATNVDLSKSNPFDGELYWPTSAAQLSDNFVDLGPIFGYHSTYEQWTENNP